MKLKDAEAELAELNKEISLNGDDYSRERQLSNAIVKHRRTYFNRLYDILSDIRIMAASVNGGDGGPDPALVLEEIEHMCSILADAKEVEA